MKGDMPEPAFRLLMQLPVRTHERREVVKKRYVYPKPVGSGGQNRRQIKVEGVLFESVKDAWRKFRVSFDTIKRWVSEGSAEYV